ncbi:nitrogen permease regulator of amino acid transport activity 3-domain-containing protein [Kockovaella imperatae]|uniref:Nitrogen permease regulator 3 n=1 Tax=Kockovaella imperatae TaxID=4999 RepID=A0A1Y1UM80_9TREE|nr:nitrogen permease regulator of amino acid transport activity 3-domain-containing protein [Kockovaella imperatae]ORX39153.1 nitrogen permease regulator of amino acid transport activity 3-domain-containing protein [Kockovaella imperatae]
MAENILGILFVTSSSRGRNVFRYPPDPLSPHTRLTQPIYPSATFTASEAIRKNRPKPTFDSLEGRRSNGTSTRGSHVRLSKMLGSETSRTGTSNHDHTDRDIGDGTSSDSSASSGEEPEYTWTASAKAKRPSVEPPPKLPVPVPEKESFDSEPGAVTFDTANRASRGSRGSRGSIADIRPIPEIKPLSSPAPPIPAPLPERQRKGSVHEQFIESQYNFALSYTLDFLGDMLTPPPAARNRKFEICVDELVFVGYPVSVGADGKWTFAADDDEVDLRPTARGRRKEGLGHLGTVVEAKEFSSPDADESKARVKDGKDGEGIKAGEEDGPPSLTMFNLVLILDKPDPRISHDAAEGLVATTLYDEVYREIVFKWTAAAYSLQVSDNYVAKEAWEMAKVRDKGINENMPILECCRMLYERSSLDRALNQLFASIYQYQRRPKNPLYSSLPTTITVSLGSVPISMILSSRTKEVDEAWAHWGEIDDVSDVSSEDSDAGHGDDIRSRDLRVEPWNTLLLIDDDAVEQAQEISRSLVGLGIGVGDPGQDEAPPTAVFGRRGSKEEEDEGHLMKSLIGACDVSKRLLEIAHQLRYHLEGIVIPLARELVQNKKAILVDVMNTRLRTVVMPTTLADHTLTIYDYSHRFHQRFPRLPPLPQFLAAISASPVQFRELVPKSQAGDAAIRENYLDALVWLLKQDLVVQVRIRCRVFARPEVKEIAWRRLWARRRGKWLRRKRERKIKSADDDLGTPRARDDAIDPLDASVPPLRKDNSNDLEYDPDLEMDSDNEDGAETSDAAEIHGMKFSEDQEEPTDVPHFEESFIFRPARAQKDEARWLRVIREGADEVWASKFDL